MEQHSFFEKSMYSPLAAKLRPKDLSGFVGQEHLLAPGKVLLGLIEIDQIPSMIFWGPPGVGKTTLARIIAEMTSAEFINFSAVQTGIKEIKEIMGRADQAHFTGKKTILFIDEIHRFNKAQQDAFLPYVEKGSIILIGATTENPSFEVNSALLSRCKVFVMQALTQTDLEQLIKNAENWINENGDDKLALSDRYISMIAGFANGDARTALNTLEMITTNSPVKGGMIDVTDEIVEQCISRKFLIYDKGGEEHYNIISALHKSMRNSDVQAAVYWLARMLEGGEDPLYIARRVTRFASEDIGMADSNALEVCIAAYQACHYIGMPECSVHLTHAVVYCSLAPKSNALDAAYISAKRDALETLAEPVPLVIRNAPTKLMKELDYGKGYKYAHDYENKITDMKCMPDSLEGRVYYEPTDQGREAKVKEWMDKIEALRKL